MARVELEGEWTIATIDGAPVLEEGDAFLGFGQDGRISGNTSVNRLLGAWSLEQGQLSLGQLGSTRMAGPPKLMEQEGRLLAALERVASAERDDRGHLHLRSADGQVLMTASPRR